MKKLVNSEGFELDQENPTFYKNNNIYFINFKKVIKSLGLLVGCLHLKPLCF
jgi:hypothetical protein